jgi:hypothetical protein
MDRLREKLPIMPGGIAGGLSLNSLRAAVQSAQDGILEGVREFRAEVKHGIQELRHQESESTIEASQPLQAQLGSIK